ncbi:hypothetical protein FRB94_004241 [Tulasnella sp. JGI-2019a]|nr:hypothetical protein FRB93_000241 [Tulasnella sp. JGI-2019a]KAG9015122.1 hypothetical protein FRB94_004241 [Tulasnella sp. JGI-2019a]
MVYKLSSTLKAHSSDVRSVASPTPRIVLSASRDTTAIVWTRPDEQSSFENTSTLSVSARFVNAITYLRPTTEAPQGYAVTGSQDAIINVYAIGAPTQDPAYTLLGHSNNVCSLDTTAGGAIISGSWDQTARIWKDFQPAYELKGHSASVLAVLAVNEEEYLTASADKTIKSWKLDKALHTFSGHQDAVRDLALIPEVGFASCSNDGDIRVWTIEGDLVHTLAGHTSFVYSLTVLPSGDIVSSGEDRTVRVWRDGECLQTLVHPAISVWAVSSMPNGDIVSGASDKIVRVFSASEDRWASEDDLKAYDDALSNHAVPSQTEGTIDQSKLPGEEALNTPGKKEGENKLVKTTTGSVDVYTWTGGAWMKVGEMTGATATGSGEKKLYKGRQWDYVFEVDVKEGAPKLQLPYNANENPYTAAQRFLGENDLPASYLDQIARFIEQQTAGVSVGPTNSEYIDPYTGASRYQSPAMSPFAGGAFGGYSDPYTGASRYQAPASGGSSSSVAPATPKILPLIATLPFRQSNVGAMRTKLLQLNEDLKSDLTISAVAISKPELLGFDRIFAFLQASSSAGPYSSPRPLEWKDVDLVLQILSRWPESTKFPLIDILRLIISYCPEPRGAPPNAELQILDELLAAAKWNDQPTSVPAKSRDTNLLLVLRALANCFHIGSNGIGYGNGQWTSRLFLEMVKVNYEKLNTSQRLALATMLFNFSCVVQTLDATAEARRGHLELTLRVLREETSDSETFYRALVAFGNTLSSGKIREATFPGVVEGVANRFNEDRMKLLIAELRALLMMRNQ